MPGATKTSLDLELEPVARSMPDGATDDCPEVQRLEGELRPATVRQSAAAAKVLELQECRAKVAAAAHLVEAELLPAAEAATAGGVANALLELRQRLYQAKAAARKAEADLSPEEMVAAAFVGGMEDFGVAAERVRALRELVEAYRASQPLMAKAEQAAQLAVVSASKTVERIEGLISEARWAEKKRIARARWDASIERGEKVNNLEKLKG